MAGTTIDNSNNEPTVLGTDKYPVGNNSGNPIHHTADQIAAFTLAKIFPGADFVEDTHADLTSNYPPASYDGKMAWVTTTTGSLFSKKYSGWYISNGTAWIPADAPSIGADTVQVDDSGMSTLAGDDVQEVLEDIDDKLTTILAGHKRANFSIVG